MSNSSLGCCAGMAFGCIFMVVLMILAVLGVIYLCSDTFREQSTRVIENSWVEVKTNVESTVNKVTE